MLTNWILHLVLPNNAEGNKKPGRDAGPMCRENQHQQSADKSIDHAKEIRKNHRSHNVDECVWKWWYIQNKLKLSVAKNILKYI